jgi:hypothetical protein
MHASTLTLNCPTSKQFRIGRYLRNTRERGIIYKPDKSKGLEVFVDADFAGGWSKNDPHNIDSLYLL